jgi:hypothetical protein
MHKLLLCLIILIVLTACASNAPATTILATEAATSHSLATAAPNTLAPSPATSESQGNKPCSLPDVAAAIAATGSLDYHATYQVSMGQSPLISMTLGHTQAGVTEAVQDVSLMSNNKVMHQILMDDRYYQSVDNSPWIEIRGTLGQALFIAQLNWLEVTRLNKLQDTQCLAAEDVADGLRSNHYRVEKIDTSQLLAEMLPDLPRSTTGSLDVWITGQGKDEFLTRYLLRMGDTPSNEIVVDLQLTDAQVPFKISTPTDAVAPTFPADFPTPPSMLQYQLFGDQLTYLVDLSQEEAVAFYQEELPKAGWSPDQANAPTVENMQTLAFAKGSMQAVIGVRVNKQGKTTVVAIVGERQ